ncbi:MAG TPA: SprT family zinc-dependent metalloprotease [Patescibacteria group bacterium]
MANLNYQIKRSRRRTSTTSISVSEKGVIVTAPFWIPKFFIDNFVNEKEDWILRRLEHIKSKEKNNKKYTEGEKHLYFGKELSLRIKEIDVPSRTKIDHNPETLEVTIWSSHQGENRIKEIREALTSWYLEQGIGVITEKVNYYSQKIGVDYREIKIKKVSSIWGSCSPTNNLSFNRKLIMAPHEVVDYVVIHEVSHMVHRNHSSRFWGLVFKFDPLYRQHRHWLRKNSHLLSL